jgi:hypothetical protein
VSQYAQNTSVAVEKTRAEIERLLIRYGATGFAYGWSGSRSVLQFEARGRHIRFELPMPDRKDRAITHTPTGIERTPSNAYKSWEQAQRQRWRALKLIIQAKLEAIESGIVSFEDEFLANIVLPDGSRLGAWAGPQIERAYESSDMHALLPGGSS